MKKSQLRKQITELLRTLSSQDKQQQSEAVFRQVIQHPKWKSARRISIYLNTEHEIDTSQLLSRALERDKKECFVPFVRRRRQTGKSDDGEVESRMLMVKLRSIQEHQAMPLNHYGIKEFPQEEIEKLEIARPQESGGLDLVIVPGVAFASDGRRLGHGKGYYDEFFANWLAKVGVDRMPYLLGLAFRQQLVDDPLSVEGSDYRLDEVLCVDSI